MPRDGTDTRERLLDAAERLFADRGVHAATTREILDAAGQRNASALTYHFGSRVGVFEAVLLRHGAVLDDQRAELLPSSAARRTTRPLVTALVIPYTSCLGTPSGRAYVRIVAQLADQFALWNVEQDVNPPHLRRILSLLQGRVKGDAVIARERVVAVIMLMTAQVAQRARELDGRSTPALRHDAFVAALTDMLVAIVDAPTGKATAVEGS